MRSWRPSPSPLRQSMVAVVVVMAATAWCAAAQAAQLSQSYYASTCPNVETLVRGAVTQKLQETFNAAPGTLRLFFHDCFVQGCDASVLLDDSPTLTGEKNAAPNANSLRGYEVIDSIKSQVEAACPGTVSCADILALAARDGVNLVSTQ